MISFKGKQTIKGVRGDCYTGKKTEVEQRYEVYLGSLFKLWFRVIPGITGYESFEFSPGTAERIRADGWSACAGTKERYDSLFIPPDQMEIAIDDIRKQYQEELTR